MLQKLIKIYSTYTYINENKNSRRKTQHSTHRLILEAELGSHVVSHDFRRAKVVLAGWTLEVGGGATHVAPQVSCSSCKKAPGKNRNVRKEDMTGQKRQKAHFPATRNGKGAIGSLLPRARLREPAPAEPGSRDATNLLVSAKPG